MENKPIILVKIYKKDGSFQKFIVNERPEWDEEKIYVKQSDDEMILFNWNNCSSYSEKVITPKNRRYNNTEENKNEEG